MWYDKKIATIFIDSNPKAIQEPNYVNDGFWELMSYQIFVSLKCYLGFAARDHKMFCK